MGHKHSKEEILVAALDTATDEGLDRLTYGRVAKRLGINDRIVVYYFPTKAELVTEVLIAIGGRLQTTLAEAFATPADDHRELSRRAWPVLTTAEADPVFALFFEAIGLASAGHEPYTSLVPQLIEAWIAWLAELIRGDAEHRRAEAEATVALMDGLLLVRQVAGAEAADRAAVRLGVA